MSWNNINWDYRRQMMFGPTQLKSADDVFHTSASKKYALGCEYWANDGTGRAWRYQKNGGVALTRAYMNASEAPSANGLEIVQTGYTGAVGDKKFNILLATSHNYATHELIDGWLLKNKSDTDGTAIGDMYLIKDNTIVTDDTVMQIEIADTGGLRTAFSATDELSVIKNAYRDVVVNPTSQAAMVTGVNLCTVPINYYFWGQFRGPCPLIVDAGDTVVIGEPIGKAGTAGTAGAGGLIANDGTDCVWGTVMHVGASGEPAIVNLMLP